MAEHSNSTKAMTMTINEVDQQNQQIYNETEVAMKQRVRKSTKERYEKGNMTFILWMFDHHKKNPVFFNLGSTI